MATKRHHYDPRFYLEHFADPVSTLGKPSLWMFERAGFGPKLIPVENVAVRTRYYSIRKPNGEYDDIFERFLSTNEGDAAPVFVRLQKEEGTLNGNDRGKIAVFISLLLLRVPAARNWVERNIASLERVRSRAMARAPGVLESAAEELERESGEKSPTSVEEIREFLLSDRCTIKVSPSASLEAIWRFGFTAAQIIQDMRWDVLKSENQSFLTSDNPVTYLDPTRYGGVLGAALLARDVELTFPISPSTCLLATHNKVVYDDVVAKAALGQKSIYAYHVPEIFYRLVPPFLVNEINRRTVSKATRYVFSSDNTLSTCDFIATHFCPQHAAASGS